MCNPRRIEVTATRQVREAWEREVERVARVATRISGEARIRQPLDASLGGPALTTLQNLLLGGFAGWQAQDDGSFRHDVNGGYVLYHLDERQLEIVATVSEELLADGRAHEVLRGEVDDAVTTRAEARYYDDGWGGQTEESAQRAAQRAAEAGLGQAARERLAGAADAAESQRDAALRADAAESQRDAALRAAAAAAAQAEAERRGRERQPELNQRAREQLQEVGIRARQAFHRLLAHAYRDALLSLARRRGAAADEISVREDGETLEIDFLLPN